MPEVKGLCTPQQRANDGAVATTGEVFADGSMIDLIRGLQDGKPRLMFWDGAQATVGSRVEHNGRYYEPARINGSVLRELTLPMRCSPHGSTREFLAEICGLISKFVGIQEESVGLVARVVLCSALVDAVAVAPTLLIVGPDTARGNRLVALLHCLCRHSLRLTGVTPAGFCSLASGPRFTYLISQSSLSDKLNKVLDDASSREQKIPFRGGLLDLFGVQVIHSHSIVAVNSWPVRSIQISMIPTGQELPVFDFDERQRITSEFQAKLLSFRRENFAAARVLQFDASKLPLALRDLAGALAAATPDDAKLQAEVIDLLRERAQDLRGERWTELSSIAIESVLVAGREGLGKVVYIRDLADIAQEILRRRGEINAELDPAVLGKRLQSPGFRDRTA